LRISREQIVEENLMFKEIVIVHVGYNVHLPMLSSRTAKSLIELIPRCPTAGASITPKAMVHSDVPSISEHFSDSM